MKCQICKFDFDNCISCSQCSLDVCKHCIHPQKDGWLDENDFIKKEYQKYLNDFGFLMEETLIYNFNSYEDLCYEEESYLMYLEYFDCWCYNCVYKKMIEDENRRLKEENNKLKILLIQQKCNKDILKSIYNFL